MKDMIKLRPWAFWRRIQYGSAFGSFWVVVAVIVYFTNFYAEPSCFDNIQNGTEEGVDCDGSCVRICNTSVIPPRVVWAESFSVVDGQYNAVAYIENKNAVASTKEIAYTFKLLDSGSVIAERKGVTILPPNSSYPIFEGRILTDNGREPTETIVELSTVEVWQPATIGVSQFRVSDYKLESTDSKPRLTAKIENTELTSADKVEVIATIFNNANKPLTASQTFIDNFAPRSTRDAVFTWPRSIATTIRSCEVPSDIMLVLDRSGSMAADGGDPVEPLNSAKVAAQSFVNQAKATTQIGFFSYATIPASPIEQVLTLDTNLVKAAINKVEMGKDGVQYTNMGDAFKVAYEELKSRRHRDDARKVIILMTDGDITRPVNPETGELDRVYAANYAREMATLAKVGDTTIYTIGFGDLLATSSDASLVRDADLIRDLASSQDHYFAAPTVKDLERVYKEIAGGICEDGPTRVEIITKTATNFTPLQ